MAFMTIKDSLKLLRMLSGLDMKANRKNIYADLKIACINYSQEDNGFGFAARLSFGRASIYDEAYFW